MSSPEVHLKVETYRLLSEKAWKKVNTAQAACTLAYPKGLFIPY